MLLDVIVLNAPGFQSRSSQNLCHLCNLWFLLSV
jgi:hypothetical protein